MAPTTKNPTTQLVETATGAAAAPARMSPLNSPPGTDQRQHKRPISAKLRKAINTLATNPKASITEAAEQAGMRRESLSHALAKPHVKTALIQAALTELSLEAATAPVRIGALARDAESEHVRLEANKVLLKQITDSDQTSSTEINIQINLG